MRSVRLTTPVSQTSSALSEEDNSFLKTFDNAVIGDDIDSVKSSLVDSTINWQHVATPALKSLMTYSKLKYTEYEIEPYIQDEKTKREFWTTLADRLVKDGADVNAALTDATDPTSLEFLVNRGANVNALDENGCTALYWRSIGDVYEDAVAFLISKGADVNAADREGNTPLHQAAKNNSVKVIARLLAAGANVNAKNNKGQTALCLANLAMQNDASALLKSSGGTE